MEKAIFRKIMAHEKLYKMEVKRYNKNFTAKAKAVRSIARQASSTICLKISYILTLVRVREGFYFYM